MSPRLLPCPGLSRPGGSPAFCHAGAGDCTSWLGFFFFPLSQLKVEALLTGRGQDKAAKSYTPGWFSKPLSPSPSGVRNKSHLENPRRFTCAPRWPHQLLLPDENPNETELGVAPGFAARETEVTLVPRCARRAGKVQPEGPPPLGQISTQPRRRSTCMRDFTETTGN